MIKKISQKLICSTNPRVALLLGASAILMYLPFLKPQLSLFIFVALVPLIMAIDLMQKHDWSAKKMSLPIWLMGLVFMALTTSWILNINTNGWSYIPSSPLFVIIVFCWLVFSILLSLGFLLFGYCIAKFRLKLASYWAILILPSLWILTEFLRSYLATLGFIGKEGTLGNFFSFGSLGIAAGNTPLVFAGRIIGLYGLGFLVVAINIGLYYFLKKQWKPALVVIALSITLSAIGYFAYYPIGPKENVAVMQLSQNNKSSYTNELISSMYSESHPKDPIQLLIMPEYANFFEFGNTKSNESFLKSLLQNNKALIIYSRSKSNPNGLRKNEIVYQTSNDEIINIQEKNFLIPTGEYMPYLIQSVLKIIGQDQITDVFTKNVGVAKGGFKEHAVIYDSVTYGALACSGIIAPQLYRELTKDGAQILVNTASLDIFNDSSTFREQAFSMAKFIAASNARPFLQSARGGNAFIMDSNGNIIARSKDSGIAIVRGEVDLNTKKTIYTMLGEYMLAAAASILIIFGFIRLRKFKRNK